VTHLFCDESGTAADQHILAIGVLKTREPERLREMIEAARASHRLRDELHYWKHSRRKLALYDEVLSRVWECEARFEAMVVDKRFVDMAHFGGDKYLMLNGFLVQALKPCLAPGGQAALHLDHRERLADLAQGLLPQLNALLPNALGKVEIADSKQEPLIQLCDFSRASSTLSTNPDPRRSRPAKRPFPAASSPDSSNTSNSVRQEYGGGILLAKTEHHRQLETLITAQTEQG